MGLWLFSDRGLSVSGIRNFLSADYSPANVYSLLSKMAADGLTLPLSGGNYRLAPGGLRTLKEAFPALFSAVNVKFFYCLAAAGGIGLAKRYRLYHAEASAKFGRRRRRQNIAIIFAGNPPAPGRAGAEGRLWPSAGTDGASKIRRRS